MVSESKPLLSPSKPLSGVSVGRAAAPSKLFGDVLWSPKLMYTISNMGVSAYINYLAVFYENTAMFSKFQIGVLQALPCICTILGPPFWCALADKYQNHRFVHVCSIICGALLIYAVSLSRSFPVTLALILLANFVASPSGSLLDHAVLDMISKYGGEYGKQRLFGAVGYGAGAYLAGLVVAAGGIAWAFNVSVAFSFTSLLVLRQIPVPSHHNDEPEPAVVEDGKHNPLERKPSFSQAMRELAHKTDVIVLMGVVLLMGLMYGVLSSFLTLNLYNLSGGNAQIIGIAIMCETTSELPFFFFSQKLIDSLGTVKVLLLSISGYALRITYYAFMTNAWSAIPFEFLHGLTFGITWAAVTQYLYKAAPRGAEGTMMGLLNAVLNGAGRGGGTLIGGYFYEHYGAQTMWLITDLGVPLSLLGLAAQRRLHRSPGDRRGRRDIRGGELRQRQRRRPGVRPQPPGRAGVRVAVRQGRQDVGGGRGGAEPTRLQEASPPHDRVRSCADLIRPRFWPSCEIQSNTIRSFVWCNYYWLICCYCSCTERVRDK